MCRFGLLVGALLVALHVGAGGQEVVNGRRSLPPEFLVRASVRKPPGTQAPRPARIFFNYKDDKNHYALVVGAKDARLVRVLGGKTVVLAGPVAVATVGEEPVPILVKRKRRRITCFVGAGAPLSAADATFGGGRAGRATSEGGLEVTGFRVLRVGAVQFADDFMRAKGEPDPWTRLAGTWELDRVPNPTWSPNPFRFIGKGKGVGLAAAGHPFWHDYAVRAAVQPGEGCGAAGLAFYVEDSRNYLAFRLVAPASAGSMGAVELVRVRAGKEAVVVRAEGELDPQQWYELGVAVQGDSVAAFLDGRCVLATTLPGLKCGKVGLYCRDAAGARFDDVAVQSVRLPEQGFQKAGLGLAADVLPERRTGIAERFRTDRYMQQWASELGSWVPEGQGRAGRAYWHIGLFPGDFTLTWRADEPLLFEQGPLEVAVAPESRDTAKGYSLLFSRDATTGRLNARLARLGKTVASWRVDVPAKQPISALAVERRGASLRVLVGGRQLGSYTDKQPLAVRRLRLRCAWVRKRTLKADSTTGARTTVVQLPAVQNFEVACPQLRDYVFHRAPVDWLADTGSWEITARWICLPMFTWLGGRSHESAILWNKRQYAGDVIADVHAAVMMSYGPMSGYDRYGDLNITICGDGRDLSSGYSVLFGGSGNTATRILRRNKVVAETRSVLYPSRGQGAHVNWYHVRVEKRGARILLFINNTLAAQYTDPAPLAGKRIAIWTWNRGLMIARARIWAERDDGVPAFGPARPPQPRRGPSKGQRGANIQVSSTSHPSVYYNFDRGPEGWHCPTGEHGGRIRWEPRGDGGCLRVENARTGGDFAAFAPLAKFDAAQLQRLSFDYRLTADVRINLYFRSLGRWHVVGFTGPTAPRFHTVTESREISGRATATAGLQLERRPPVVLGRIAAVADGRWHHAAFDLWGALRAAHPSRSSFVVEDLHFGNWSNEGYLQCGFGGNRRGASYWLDNVFLGRHGGGSGKFTWRQDAAKRTAWKCDRSPTTVPDLGRAGEATEAALRGLGSGVWFLHVADGATVRHHRFLVDVDPPTVASVDPKPHSRGAPTALRLKLADPGGAGLDPRSVSVVVAGRAIAPDCITVSGDALRVDMSVDLRDVAFQHEQRVRCEVTAADRAGNRLGQPFRWEWTFDRSLDKTPPTIPGLVSPAPSGWDEDFEARSDEWGRFPGSAWVDLVLDDATAASGQRCLRIEGGPGPYRCYVRRKAFDVRAFPVLSFDYLADDATRWDLAFLGDKGWRVVSVNGGTRHWPVIGSLEGYVADGKWHRADLPIGKLLTSAKGNSAPVVRAVAIVASNLTAGQTSVLRLDGMRLAPAAYAAGPLKLRWRSRDVSGIRGYSYVVDRKPNTVPDAKVSTQAGEAAIANVPAGPVFFHCRALDNAGNWGPTLHQQLLLRKMTDTRPPEVTVLWPKPGARAAADTIRVRVRDEGTGVAAGRLRFTVAGKTYDLGSPELRFLPEQSAIEWTAARDGTHAAPAFENGTTIHCKLDAADYAGNAVAKPVVWSWTMDFALDKTPPAAPYVTWIPDGALVDNDFEEGPGHWMGRREGWATVTDDFAAAGSRCISFGGFSTFMHFTPFDAARFPIVGFDYRLEPGARLNLMARIENRNWEIRFNAKGAKYPRIGALDGIVADGKWHSCRFDLASMLRAAPIPPRLLIVDHLATLNRSRRTSFVDNFFIAPAAARGFRVRWSVARDPTGIAGYSFVLDRSPSTVPDTKIDGVAAEKTYAALEPGAWHFHVRARDGAGNWGPAAHVRIAVAKGRK